MIQSDSSLQQLLQAGASPKLREQLLTPQADAIRKRLALRDSDVLWALREKLLERAGRASGLVLREPWLLPLIHEVVHQQNRPVLLRIAERRVQMGLRVDSDSLVDGAFSFLFLGTCDLNKTVVATLIWKLSCLANTRLKQQSKRDRYFAGIGADADPISLADLVPESNTQRDAIQQVKELVGLLARKSLRRELRIVGAAYNITLFQSEKIGRASCRERV